MNTFGYSATKIIRDYEWLRLVTFWAGGLGLVQALIWMGLNITAILSYNCVISVEPASYGSLLGLVFVELYFKGDCTPNGMLGYDFSLLHSVGTMQNPQQLFIWEIVYLVVATCWFLSSFFLLTQLDKYSVKFTSSLVIVWCIITLCILILDTILGVFFSLDFDNFHGKAYDYNFSTLLSGAVTPAGAQLLAGYIVTLLLIFISFKLFIVYIANFVLMIYLLVHVARILRNTDTNDTLFIVRKDSDNVLDRSPINAFDVTKSAGYVNDSYVSESVETVELNQDAIARAARMSSDVAIMDRRFRNLDGYQQYSLQRAQNFGVNNSKNTKSSIQSPDPQYPAPDYTPPISRAYRGCQ